eukprot:symbB.v1.2.017450.t1/scaffold1364.1/size123310/2
MRDDKILQKINDSYVRSLMKMMSSKVLKELRAENETIQKHLNALTKDDSVVSLKAAPKTLASANGWKVVEEILPDGCALRWMVCEEAFSLDQTRVKLGPITSTGERHFDRLHLRAVSHQIMALVTALFPGPVRMCMLGGGGMAIPMALLSLSDEMMEVEEIHVVELHQVVIDFAEDFFGAKDPKLRVHQGDALDLVIDGRLADGKKFSTFLVDVDFMRFAEAPEKFLSTSFWRMTWAMLQPNGLVAVNVIGCEADGLASLINVALNCAPSLYVGLMIGPEKVEGWTRMRPKPGVVIFGPQHLLQLLQDLQHQNPDHPLDAEWLQERPWLQHLARDVLHDLATKSGTAGVELFSQLKDAKMDSK